MKKLFRSKKALSPVVAAIILIAVTVAVSLAVAAWMGALTIGQMGSASVTIKNVTFVSPANVTLRVKNTGTKTVTIATVKVNNQDATAPQLTLAPGQEENLKIQLASDWVAGNPYKFDLFDGSGQIIGSYQATAPSQ
ncbi:hypothetical protein J7K27_00420 [Candidatus Bathyarchaeota archaeon]|nr:hypothetical protein [Candidatus Bathyarchaeota archaeon]